MGTAILSNVQAHLEFCCKTNGSCDGDELYYVFVKYKQILHSDSTRAHKMTANTMPLSQAEDEVRKILDEAINTSVTASNPGIPWRKLMTIIQMQRPLVDGFFSHRRKVQSLREVNIGDNVNPFRAEIVKLIYAMQLTGHLKNTNATTLDISKTNWKVKDSHEVSSYDNCPQAEHKIRINQKSNKSKWIEKHFGEENKMHEVSDETQLFNRFEDAGEGQNSAPFSFTFSTHKGGIAKVHKSEQPNEPNIDNAAYKDDYNSYLVARYENEYGDEKVSGTKSDKSCELHDEEEEGHCTENYVYAVNKSSVEQVCVYSVNQQEDQSTPCSTNHKNNQNLQKCKSKDDIMHCYEQSQGPDMDKVSLHYRPEISEKLKEESLRPRSFSSYSATCAGSASEHLAQMSHKKTTEYTQNKKLQNQSTDEQNELQHLSEVTESKNVCRLYGTQEQTHHNDLTNSVPKDNSPTNKMFPLKNQLHLSSISGSLPQLSNERHITDAGAYATKDGFNQSSPGSAHATKYLFQNFIQPEDEKNIQLLLEDNLSSGHKSLHHTRFHSETEASLTSAIEKTLEEQGVPQSQENTVDEIKISKTELLEHSSQAAKTPCDNLNNLKETLSAIKSKSVLQDCQMTDNYIAATEQIMQTQQHLNKTNNSTDTTVSNCISIPCVNAGVNECQNKNLSDQFSNKKVYWSSVGLIIEELVDSNILPVAGHSDMMVAEPQDSHAEEESSSLYNDGSTREQMTDTGISSCCEAQMPHGYEETSFIIEPNIMGSTNLLSKDRSISEKLSPENPADKSKHTKQSKQKKRSFFKTLQQAFHLSRKH